MNRRAVVLVCAYSAVCIASGHEWAHYLKRVATADPATIQGLPVKIKKIGDSLDDERAAQLAIAISQALVNDPVNVLKATDLIESYTDDLQQRFGTSLICSIPGQNQYSQEDIEEYFSQAEVALLDAGIPAEKCLNTMRDTFAEIRQKTDDK